MSKYYFSLLLIILFCYTLGGSGTYSGDFEFANGLKVKTSWDSNTGINLDITLKIDSTDCKGNASITVALMKERKFLEDEIIAQRSVPIKVDTYYFDLGTDEVFDDEQTYYVYMRNWCGFEARGSISIDYSF